MASDSVKWVDAQITGFNVFKWNERLVRNNLGEEEGMFLFRRDDGRVKRVFRFDLFTMAERAADPATGHFLARDDGHGFAAVLTKSRLFEEVEPFVAELTLLLRTFFEFSGFTVNCPFSPRLVFVVDFSYRPIINLVDALLVVNEDDYDDDEDEAEDDALDMYTSDMTDVEDGIDDNGEEADSGEKPEANGADGEVIDVDEGDVDVEASYTDEMEEIVAQLRIYRGVARTYPIIPLSLSDPTGLVQVDMPLVELLQDTAPVDCAVCLNPMEANEVVLKTKCGRLLHKTCSLSWLNPLVKCPLCRSCKATLL